MLVLFLIVLLSVLNLRVSASYIRLRQDTNNGCIAACYPPPRGGADQKAYNTDLCTDEIFVVLVCLQQEGCSGSDLAAAVSDLKSRCNSVGVNLSVSMNTPLNTQIATPTNTPSPTLTSHSTTPSDTSTTPPTTSPISTSPSETASSHSKTSTSTSPSASPPPSSDNNSSTNIGLIVGGIVGLIVALAVLVCATILYCRRRSRKGSPSASSSSASFSGIPLLWKDGERDDESVEKPRPHDAGAVGSVRERHTSVGSQQQLDTRSETHGGHASSIGHSTRSSESGVHQTEEAFNHPTSDYGADLVRRPTDCGYEDNTRRQDIGSVLRSMFSQGPPSYEEGEGLLKEASSTSHGH